MAQYWAPTNTGGRERRYAYARSRQEALRKLREGQAQARTPASSTNDSGRTTVGEYLDFWLEEVARNDVAHRTYHNYRSQIENHIRPAFGRQKLKALGLEDVERLYGSMTASGCSPTTVRYAHAVLRRALGRAVVRGLVPRNVAEGASLPRLVEKEKRILTPEEAKRLLKAARGERLEALFLAALTCGLRQGELLALRWEEVDLEAPKITVRRQLQRSRDGSGMIVVPTKNKKSRAIRPGSAAVEALGAHRQRQAEEMTAARGLWKDPGLVFATTIGTPLDASNLVARDFKPLLQRAGLPIIRFHDLRHGCGSLLLSEGVPVKVVQEILGHSSMSITMDVYAHVLPDMQERAAAAMDGLFVDR